MNIANQILNNPKSKIMDRKYCNLMYNQQIEFYVNLGIKGIIYLC